MPILAYLKHWLLPLNRYVVSLFWYIWYVLKLYILYISRDIIYTVTCNMKLICILLTPSMHIPHIYIHTLFLCLFLIPPPPPQGQPRCLNHLSCIPQAGSWLVWLHSLQNNIIRLRKVRAACDTIMLKTPFSGLKLLNSLFANYGPLSVSNLDGMPWTAKWCLIFVIVVLDYKSLRAFILNQFGGSWWVSSNTIHCSQM